MTDKRSVGGTSTCASKFFQIVSLSVRLFCCAQIRPKEWRDLFLGSRIELFRLCNLVMTSVHNFIYLFKIIQSQLICVGRCFFLLFYRTVTGTIVIDCFCGHIIIQFKSRLNSSVRVRVVSTFRIAFKNIFLFWIFFLVINRK
jgi:hypothetical protein